MARQEKIKVLVIDSEEADYIIVRGILIAKDASKFSIQWVASYTEGLRAMKMGSYDAYLISNDLGGYTALDLIREALKNDCQAPFIILAGEYDSEIDRKAAEEGAADYMVKGSLSARNLESSIRYAIAHSKHMREIRLLNANLEKRVKDRTMILEEALRELESSREELSRALDREKELNELKSRFVSMASHEFRTPLATILSSIALVSKYNEQGENEKQARHVARIKSAITHLTDLLNDVLSLSKLEEGKIAVSPENFDITEFTGQLVQELQGLSKEKQQLKYKHTGPGEVQLDKKILKSILTNLVSNAIKFSSENKTIHINTEVVNSKVKLSVKDQGIGISDEDQKHLFERFFRGQNATNIQGTGLGLNIVGKYVEMLGGSIDFKSKLEEGTTFTVKLPNS